MTSGQQIIVNSRKYDQSIRRSWTCSLVTHEDPLLLLEGVFDTDIVHPDLGQIESGTTSYEYYWLNRWYNIFRFHAPDGTLRNFYCNISMPPTFAAGVLDYVDLDIDVVVWPDASYEVLDLAEFEANAERLAYPGEVKSSAMESLEVVLAMIANGELPFPGEAAGRATDHRD